MKTVSIRQLSGAVLEAASSHEEILGITNAGALTGVLVPISQRAMHRMAHRDSPDLLASVQRARNEMASGKRFGTLSEPPEGGPEGSARPAFTRISIRELSGARIERASAAGETLLVTKDRTVLGLLVPVTQQWVERLVESNVARFLGDEGSEPAELDDVHRTPVSSAVDADPTMAMEVSTVETREARVSATPSVAIESLRKRAIGIKIIADDPDGRERLVGVVTDILGAVIGEPEERILSSVSKSNVFAHLLTLVDELRARLNANERLLGVGLEIGGHVHEGRVVYSPNASWNKFPLADRLADALDVPVILENDANALAVYERWFHGIDDDRFAVVLITSVGVGTGLVLDGRVYHGSHGMAGELGHIPIEFNDRGRKKCRCENPGCLEGVATPYAIGLTLPDYGFHDGYEKALQAPGVEAVRTVFGLAGSALGRAIANVINILNPSAIVIHAPRHLLGVPRELRIESDAAATGIARVYVEAMLAAIKAHSFSTGAEDCRFIIRTSAEENGAAAAAASLIRRVAHRERETVGDLAG